MKRVLITLAAAAAALAGAPPAAADMDWFASPSGNISCMMDVDWVRCDIRERDWSPPPRPADCSHQTDFGQGISLNTAGPAAFVCAGDTTLGADSVLPYGLSRGVPGLECESRVAGITCTNNDGHGFFLSRQAYRLF